MADKKKAKKKIKKKEQKKGPEKKGLPIIPIIGVILAIIILGGWIFMQSLNDPFQEINVGVPEEGIDVLQAPMTASEGDEITLIWRIVGTNADSSQVVYSRLPKGGFGEDFDPSTLEVDGSGYENIAEGQITDSEFEGQTYTATITVEYLPTFLRIHAKKDETNYWTDEIVVMGQ